MLKLKLRLPRLFSKFNRSQLASQRGVMGRIDSAVCTDDGQIQLNGWMLEPRGPIDSIRVYVDGQCVGTAQIQERADLKTHFPAIAHAIRGGFSFSFNPGRGLTPKLSTLELKGYYSAGLFQKLLRLVNQGSDDTLAGTYETFIRLVSDRSTVLPPPDLMQRVCGCPEAAPFVTGGLKLYHDFMKALRPHRDLQSVRRLLDWGCGCGRTTTHLLQHLNGPEIYGCDIDGEAVAWCNANLKSGHFAQSQPLPSLPYPNGFFDVIVSCSVFSHLKRDIQHLWLAELKRVLSPGGLLLASFHGMFAASSDYPAERVEAIERAGIVDDTADDALGNIVEKGYYMATFQTREYTLREWSKHFEILDYLEAGMHNYQDLVVLRADSFDGGLGERIEFPEGHCARLRIRHPRSG